MAKPLSNQHISVIACLLLVLLRVSIGWQFLYEGLWKYKTFETSRPWSAEGYLSNSQGPLRPFFRSLASDPDNLLKLDYKAVSGSWDEFYNRFVAEYSTKPAEASRLTDAQKRTLNNLLNGPGEFVQPLEALPEGSPLAKPDYKFGFKKPTPPEGSFVKYDAAKKRLVTNAHLLPEDGEALKKQELAEADEKDPKVAEFHKAIDKLVERSGRLSLKEKLQVLLVEDRDRNGFVQAQFENAVDARRPGDVDAYRHLLKRYNEQLNAATIRYQHDHLGKNWGEIQEKKAKLSGPVDALTAELHAAAFDVLTTDQQRAVPFPKTSVNLVNMATIWTLIILGSLMIVGLFTRLASLGSAGLLLMFYLAMPPWPGIPEAPGPEHSMIVNKNLIEVFACLAFAFLPSGRWLGLDALIRRVIFRQTTD